MAGLRGKHNLNRKATAISTAAPAAFSCIIAQSFFPGKRIKTSMAGKYHFIATVTVQTTSMKIGIVYSVDTLSLKTAYVDTRWLGRQQGQQRWALQIHLGRTVFTSASLALRRGVGKEHQGANPAAARRAGGGSRTAQTRGQRGEQRRPDPRLVARAQGSVQPASTATEQHKNVLH